MKFNLNRYAAIQMIFVAALFYPSITQAQEVKVLTFKQSSFNSSHISIRDFYQIGDFFYGEAFAAKGFGATIYKYDTAMNEVKNILLGGRDDKYGPYFPKLVLFNNKLLFFYFKVKEDRTAALFMMNINTETLDNAGTQEICTISKDAIKSSAASIMQLHFCISPDKKKLLVVRSDDYSEVFSCIIDESFKIIRKHLSGVNNLVEFTVGNIFIDNDTNEYIGYRYNDTRQSHKYGLLMENEKGDAFWETFNGPPVKTYITDVNFGSGADGSKVYVYANYHAGTEVGVKLAVADGGNLVTKDEQLLLYPEDLKESIYKEGFGEKHKGVYSTNEFTYTFTEIGNGTMVLTGYPAGVHLRAADKHNQIYERKVGSIINVFIKNNTPIFKTVKTKQTKLLGGGIIVFEDKGNLVCIYNGNRETFTPAGNEASGKDDNDIVLGKYVANSDGVEISRQQIAETPGKKNYYLIISNIPLPGRRYLMPIGYEKGAFSGYDTAIVQWVALEIP